ncbi:MAG: GHMP kinase [Chloroflexi bacterium]|nr:GHMP kinase [Chloroflexota bacterium]
MLIVRAPLRISFAGGGTDFDDYHQIHGGLVVSTTINKYVYVIVTTDQCDGLQIISANTHSLYHIPPNQQLLWNGDLALPQAIADEFAWRTGVNLFIAAEVPPGTGLGSSSAVAVAMIAAFAALGDRPMERAEIAELACRVEIEKLGMPIGRQDQYASAFGGFNAIHFGPAGTRVERLALDPSERIRFESELLLFFTGVSRDSAAILRSQRRATVHQERTVISSLHEIRRAAEQLRESLLDGEPDAFGATLDAGWEQKKRLATGISNASIDECYAEARRLGATGGKITGAGGGGFLLLSVPVPHQLAVTEVLESRGLRRVPFRFEDEGVRVLLNVSARRAA